MAKQRILALDIGASSVKLAEFVSGKAGDIELVKFGVSSLGIDQAHESERLPHITAAIQELLRETGIRPGPVVLSVSGQSVFSRFVKLPPVDREKVYQIILYEAQQNVPFPINEVVWDYQLIGRGEGELDVMLAAIKADIIVGLAEAVEEAGLETDVVDVAPMALYNAVRFNYTEATGCTLVVDVGARSTDLIFIEEGRVFIRSVPVAGNAVTQQIMREFELSHDDAEDMKHAHAFVSLGGVYEEPKSEVAGKVSKIVRNVMTRMHAEIDRSIKFYRTQQSGMQPSLILLTGGSSMIPHADTFLREKLKVEVDYLNPFINVPVNQSIDNEAIGAHAHELGQVVGLALRKALTCPIEINLLPPNVVESKRFRKKQPVLVAAMFCLVVAAAVWCGYLMKLSSLATEELAAVRGEVQRLEVIEKSLQVTEAGTAEVRGKIDEIAKLVSSRSNWLEVLDALNSVLPEDLFLVSVKPVRVAGEEAGGELPGGAVREVEIIGLGYTDKVPTADPIRAFRDALRGLEVFSDATEFTSLPAPTPGERVRRFTLSVVLENPLI